MSRGFNRRQFLQASLAATAGIGLSAIRHSAFGAEEFGAEEYVPAIVIGSGFGGAVASLRLGKAKIKTIVLERGRRWTITDAGDTFCTSRNVDGRSTWLKSKTIIGNNPIDINVYTGLLDIKIGNGIAVYRGAGVGGSSLVYSAISYQPPRDLFYKVFPSSINYDELDRIYYPRVRSILKPSAIPDDILNTDYYLQSRVFQQMAAKAGFKTRKFDVAIDWDIVRQEIAGQKVASAIAGETLYGMNSGAKNSLDRNYLEMAEATGYVQIRPLHVVNTIEEINNGRFRIVCNQINEQGNVVAQNSFVCRYLFLAAGSIGTTELLLRAKHNNTLRRLNDQVGKFWGTNSNFINIVATGVQTNPAQGAPATAAIEFFDNPIAPVVLEQSPAPSLPQGLIIAPGQTLAKPEGYFTYNSNTQSADLFWPSDSGDNQKFAQAVKSTYDKFNQANNSFLVGATNFGATYHPLGGAVMDAVCDTYGKVKNYSNLFVVDGSLIPGSTGCVNPSLTIAALAERCMDRFIAQRDDDDDVAFGDCDDEG